MHLSFLLEAPIVVSEYDFDMYVKGQVDELSLCFSVSVKLQGCTKKTSRFINIHHFMQRYITSHERSKQAIYLLFRPLQRLSPQSPPMLTPSFHPVSSSLYYSPPKTSPSSTFPTAQTSRSSSTSSLPSPSAPLLPPSASILSRACAANLSATRLK